jgi:hypothetical protein
MPPAATGIVTVLVGAVRSRRRPARPVTRRVTWWPGPVPRFWCWAALPTVAAAWSWRSVPARGTASLIPTTRFAVPAATTRSVPVRRKPSRPPCTAVAHRGPVPCIGPVAFGGAGLLSRPVASGRTVPSPPVIVGPDGRAAGAIVTSWRVRPRWPTGSVAACRSDAVLGVVSVSGGRRPVFARVAVSPRVAIAAGLAIAAARPTVTARLAIAAGLIAGRAIVARLTMPRLPIRTSVAGSVCIGRAVAIARR